MLQTCLLLFDFLHLCICFVLFFVCLFLCLRLCKQVFEVFDKLTDFLIDDRGHGLSEGLFVCSFVCLIAGLFAGFAIACFMLRVIYVAGLCRSVAFTCLCVLHATLAFGLVCNFYYAIVWLLVN